MTYVNLFLRTVVMTIDGVSIPDQELFSFL